MPRLKTVTSTITGTTEHEIEVDGSTLVEKKVKTTVTASDDKVVKVILHHSRRIDDQAYAVYEVTDEAEVVTDHQVFTTLTDDEVKEFKTKWDELWCPTVTEDNLEQITENLPYEAEKEFPQKEPVKMSVPTPGRDSRINVTYNTTSDSDSSVATKWDSRAPSGSSDRRATWESDKDSGVSVSTGRDSSASRRTYAGQRPADPEYDEIKKKEAARRKSL